MSTLDRREWGGLLLAMVILVVWRIVHLSGYPLHEDELITLAVARSIAETGIPSIDGHIYWRSFLGSYLLAIPPLIGKVTLEEIRLVPAFFSVLVLPLAYRLGKDLGGVLGGALAVLFLTLSSFQSLFASFARFYLPFQFFFLLCIYLGQRYFLERKSPLPLLLATIACINLHHFALGLLPIYAIGAAVGQRFDLARQAGFWLTGCLLFALAYLVLFWAPADALSPIFGLPLQVGGHNEYAAFWEMFLRFMPLGAVLLLPAAVPAFVLRLPLWLYHGGALLVSLILLSFFAPEPIPRYFCHLFPYLLIVSAASLGWYARLLWQGSFRTTIAGRPSRAVLTATLAVGAVLSLPISLEQARGSVGTGYTYIDQEPPHRAIEKVLQPTDLLVSVDPGITDYYLGGRATHFLRERRNPETGAFSPFSDQEKGARADYFIDSPAKLDRLLKSRREKIWIYVNHKIHMAASPEMKDLLQERFALVFRDDRNQTYVFVRH